MNWDNIEPAPWARPADELRAPHTDDEPPAADRDGRLDGLVLGWCAGVLTMAAALLLARWLA